MNNIVDERELEEVREVVILGQNFNIYGDINDPIFLAAEIAAMIEYSPDKVGQMLDNVDDEEKLTDTIYRGGQQREMWFVTEFGLYELLMQSRKPLAKTFKLGVKNVLRQLRKGELGPVGSRISSKDNLMIKNAKIIFRNFSGDETQYNRKGDRNFSVVIEDPQMAEQLARDGWNVKPLKPRDDRDEVDHHIKVSVRFDNFPPKVIMVTSRNRIQLDEESICELDQAEIQRVDLSINPSKWSMNGSNGVKAYLKTMYVTVSEDEFAADYSNDDIPFD